MSCGSIGLLPSPQHLETTHVEHDHRGSSPHEARLAAFVRDTDFMAKLVDVWPSGYAQRLNDGIVRARFREGPDRPSLIEPGRIYNYDIDLWATCQSFMPGHRIRIEIASSAFPKYDRNPNTGDNVGMTERLFRAQQTVFHDREHASYVELPIVDLPPTPPPSTQSPIPEPCSLSGKSAPK
jgi:hypothetical protein